MRKLRIIFINKGSYPLFVEYCRCGCKDIRRLKVKHRGVLKLDFGQYDIYAGYENRNLKITSRHNGVKELIETPSIKNRKCIGNKMMIDCMKTRIKLKCHQSVSVANIVESLA